jgi:hypothetical protein
MLTYFALPLLDGWMYQYTEIPGIINIGEEKVLGRIDAPGWLLGFAMVTVGSLDGKYVRIHVEIDGPEKAYPIDFTIYGVHEGGSVYPSNFGPFVTRYDDTNKYYAVGMTPSHPIPFSRRIEFRLITPPTPIDEKPPLPIGYKAFITLIKIIDVEAFKRSLHRLMTPR